MFKDFYNIDQTKLHDGWKIPFTILSIAFTLLLAGDALGRILFSIENPPNNMELSKEAAKLTTMIVFCGIATSAIRLIAGGFPRPSALRLMSVLASSVVAFFALMFISQGLNAPQIPTATIVYSVGLIAVVAIEDAMVLRMKRNSASPVAARS